MTTVLEYFMQPVGFALLLDIWHNKGTSITSCAKRINVTYSHVTKLINMFELAGLLVTERMPGNARTKAVALTARGMSAVINIESFIEVLSNP